jgi:hypothetical protein
MPSPRIVNGAAPERRMTTADAAKVGGISHGTRYRYLGARADPVVASAWAIIESVDNRIC